MKRLTRLEPSAQDGEPPVLAELETVWADVFDPDIMITSAKTRRPKRFEFEIKDGEPKHNDGFSDHFPVVTTITTV